MYLEVARLSFRRYSTYRGAVAAGVFTNTVFGFIIASLLRTLTGKQTVGGLTSDSATLVVFFTQALLMTVSAFGDFEISRRVTSGEIATELHRPVDFSFFRLASDLGRSGFYVLARGIPPFLIGWLVFQFRLPPLSRLLPTLLVVGLAAAIASRLWTIVGLVSFWLTDGSGVVQLTTVLVSAFGGVLFPLQYYPEAARTVLTLLPFATLIQLPAEVFLGLRSFSTVVCLQLFWLVVLEGVLRWELVRATQKLVIQGG